jgi:hypothetical protein
MWCHLAVNINADCVDEGRERHLLLSREGCANIFQSDPFHGRLRSSSF